MQVNRNSNLEIPESLKDKLLAFRKRVWILKMVEATAGAAVGVLIGFLLTYLLDRFFDTSAIMRGLILLASAVTCGLIPIALNQWVIKRRHLEQLARLLSETQPSAGDQLLGVIELSEDTSEQSRSPDLVEAAIKQVAASVQQQDLTDAIPNPRHRQRSIAACVLASAAIILLVFTATATKNAWARFLMPWGTTPRYTFAGVQDLPDNIVVPHGEAFDLAVSLREDTEWSPTSARVVLNGRSPHTAPLEQRGYKFALPGQIQTSELFINVGDFKGLVSIEPKLRPELNSIKATIQLPKYLGRTNTLSKDVRSSSVSVVKGSATTLVARASRDLAAASVNGKPTEPSNDSFSTVPFLIEQNKLIEFQWSDRHGLSGSKPFALTIEATDDGSPTLICDNLPKRKVMLDSEVLSFTVRARDDFGVKRVGIEWQGLDEALSSTASGESILGAGDQQAEFLELAGVFSPASHKITPQPLAVRVFVEDYLPGRQRIYSPTSVFDVLDAQQHAIWITTQLARWHRMSLDVRDREMQLHETNKELRKLPTDELSTDTNLEKLSEQADRERNNGRRLKSLVQNGEGLLKEAMRNSDIAVDNLDQWAEMMQILKDISGNRMPSVADLLDKSAQQASKSASKPDSKQGKQVGKNRLTQSGQSKPGEEDDPSKDSPPPAPSINDVESTQHDLSKAEPEDAAPGKPSQGRLGLPDTKLAGNAKSDSPPSEQEPPMEAAVSEQKDLLAEFDKVADELNNILANLEGSTLVKRLKAASRKQQVVAGTLSNLVPNSFGVSEREKEIHAQTFLQLAEAESKSSSEASHIMDDMAAYFERSRFMLFQRVLDNMKEQDVTAELRLLAEDLRKQNGLAISQAEYWSDNFDRWAEDLVEVTKGGASPGGKSKGSLPPAIVLEVLQLLEGEVKLREQTRVAEQARPAVTDTEHVMTANRLSEKQHTFNERMNDVVRRILELPDAESEFDKEIGLLNQVAGVMAETTEILVKPETGPPAIAAETEIIELLLKSKRFNPNAGGGGGADPGGGGSGETETPALALVGSGGNEKENREELSATQATGTSGIPLPEEFRTGLDQYFNRLETWKADTKQ
ncbi:hypothetical protein N9B17_00070 [Rhodopirellula sp.]|nr:hypothetical protein [Rhodopirellula sp.]MDB4393991.1 hypothetical protein [Rhodopirellula sp.]